MTQSEFPNQLLKRELATATSLVDHYVTTLHDDAYFNMTKTNRWIGDACSVKSTVLVPRYVVVWLRSR